MTERLDKNIDEDFSKNIIAIWHDESHINNYVQKNREKFNILSPSFCYPQNFDKNIAKKIIVQDKENIISIKHKGLLYNIRFVIVKMLKKILKYGS